jgi:outer membrane protein assembly factor BamD (BamD/ComL family)
MSPQWVLLTAVVIVIACAQPVTAQEPKTAVEFYNRGLELMRKGELDKAVKDFSTTPSDWIQRTQPSSTSAGWRGMKKVSQTRR